MIERTRSSSSKPVATLAPLGIFFKEDIEVDAPGLTTPRINWFTYTNVPRPLWILDDL